MSYPAIAIANFFINKALMEENRDNFNYLTPMKLLKLIYIAHGWSLAINGEALINEDIEAWQYGPVIECVYHAFKGFGNKPITMPMADFNSTGVENYDIKFDANTLALLKRIWEVYKVNTGIQLSNWSHLAGSPWDKTWNKPDGKRYKGMTINNELIKQYFTEELRKADDKQSKERIS